MKEELTAILKEAGYREFYQQGRRPGLSKTMKGGPIPFLLGKEFLTSFMVFHSDDFIEYEITLCRPPEVFLQHKGVVSFYNVPPNEFVDFLEIEEFTCFLEKNNLDIETPTIKETDTGRIYLYRNFSAELIDRPCRLIFRSSSRPELNQEINLQQDVTQKRIDIHLFVYKLKFIPTKSEHDDRKIYFPAEQS